MNHKPTYGTLRDMYLDFHVGESPVFDPSVHPNTDFAALHTTSSDWFPS